MRTARTPVTLAVIIAAWGAATLSLRAAPPGAIDAEIEARLTEYRAEVSLAREHERLRAEREQVRLEQERRHRERQAALQDLLSASGIGADRLSDQAELDRFRLDYGTTATPDIALGMLPDRDEEAAAPSGGANDLAQLATNPIANLWQIQLQNVFVGESFGADGAANQMLLQPVIPWKLGDTQQITRVTARIHRPIDHRTTGFRAMRHSLPHYASKVVDFGTNGRVVTTTTKPDGSVEVFDETYRVVGDTLIVNKPGYLINARFGVAGDQLTVSAEDFSAVLQRL